MVVSKDTSPMFLINDDEVARYALTVRRLTNNIGTIREKISILAVKLVRSVKIRFWWSFWTRPLIIILPKPCSIFLFFYHCLLLSFLSSLSVLCQESSFVPSFEIMKSSDVLSPCWS